VVAQGDEAGQNNKDIIEERMTREQLAPLRGTSHTQLYKLSFARPELRF